MGQRVAWALLRLFATPGDVSLATFAAGRPEISAAVSVPDGRSPRFYAFSAFSFSGFQAGNDARAVWRKASKKAVVKCRLNGNA